MRRDAVVVLVLCGVAGDAGCHGTLSPRAHRLVETDGRGMERCLHVGELEGSSGLGMRSARNEVLEEAAKLRATHVLWGNLVPRDLEYASASARVYRCRVARVSHILYAYAGALGAPTSVRRSPAQARAAARAALRRLKRGTDFAALARAESDDPSRCCGGDLGFLGSGRMAAPFAAAVQSLEDKPVGALLLTESPFGIHVVKRTR